MGKINWIHPSYRDLIIEEMEKNQNLRLSFLKKANIEEIRLTFSDSGGSSGARIFPFIIDDESKSILQNRIKELVLDCNNWDLFVLITIIVNSISNAKKTDINWLLDILQSVLSVACERWSEEPVSIMMLEAYSNASVYIFPLPPIPKLDQTWNQIYGNFVFKIEQDAISNFYEIEYFFDFVKFVAENEPRFLNQLGFPQAQDDIFEKMLMVMEDDLNYDPILNNETEIQREIDSLNEIIGGIDKICKILPDKKERLQKISSEIRYEKISLLEEKLPPIDAENLDFDESYSYSDEFDIEALFRDL